MANTPRMAAPATVGTLGAAVSAKGQLIAIVTSDSNKMRAAAATAGHIVVGVNPETGASGDTGFVAQRGVYRFTNSTGSALTQANVGAKCYVEDSTTVASAGANNIIAGTVVDVDSNGVWVDVAMNYSTI